MILHQITNAGRLYHPGGDYQYDCSCGARFRSPSNSEAAEAFRRHMAEPVLPQRSDP